jgi:hypothetical protein
MLTMQSSLEGSGSCAIKDQSGGGRRRAESVAPSPCVPESESKGTQKRPRRNHNGKNGLGCHEWNGGGWVRAALCDPTKATQGYPAGSWEVEVAAEHFFVGRSQATEKKSTKNGTVEPLLRLQPLH